LTALGVEKPLVMMSNTHLETHVLTDCFGERSVSLFRNGRKLFLCLWSSLVPVLCLTHRA